MTIYIYILHIYIYIHVCLCRTVSAVTNLDTKCGHWISHLDSWGFTHPLSNWTFGFFAQDSANPTMALINQNDSNITQTQEKSRCLLPNSVPKFMGFLEFPPTSNGFLGRNHQLSSVRTKQGPQKSHLEVLPATSVTFLT